MQTKILIALSLMGLLGQAQAQIELKSESKAAPPSFVQTTGGLPLSADPKMPALPQLKATDAPRLQIREIDSYRGRFYQLEVVSHSQGEILEAITKAMRVKANIQPVLRMHRYPTRIIRAFRLEDLLNEAVKSDGDTGVSRSSTGTYSFVEKKESADLDLRNYLPLAGFTVGQPDIVIRAFPSKPKAPPNWGGFPFNGQQVYIVPVPNIHT